MTILYMTSTGNSLYVARSIGDKTLSIPQLIKEQRYEITDDCIGIVCPTWFGRLPGLVTDYLAKATLHADYLFLVATYGMMQADVLRETERLLAKQGIKLDYTASICMVDNWLPGFKTENQIAAIPKKKIRENLSRIMADIKARKRQKEKVSLSMRLIGLIEQPVKKIQMKPTAALTYTITDACNGCGTCTQVCPVGNITLFDKHPLFEKHCIRCQACLHHCPQNALHVPTEKSTVRFRNENIQLKDIINSNQQA